VFKRVYFAKLYSHRTLMSNRRPTVKANIVTFAFALDAFQKPRKLRAVQDVSRDRHRQIDGRSSTVPNPNHRVSRMSVNLLILTHLIIGFGSVGSVGVR
jgi:hypothetical protein